MIAAQKGYTEIVRLFLEGDKVDPNYQDDRSGNTRLWCAVRFGHRAVVKLLLERDGVDVNTKNKSGETLCGHRLRTGTVR